MASKITSKGLKRTALSVALGMCFASSVVLAQSSVGSIFGASKAGATVTIDNPATGLHREVAADSNGRFAFPQLAPGTYKVTSDGVTRNVDVRVGTGSQVSFAAAAVSELGTVTVVGDGQVNAIDVSSVESTTVFTAEQIAKLPVGRDITNVALLAPGTVKGDTAFGNLASFGGASVAENGYYINGIDVTNLRFLNSYATIPFDGIAEEQVKTGGYGAEFGRSLGGVINLVTKRGTNEWKGGVSLYWRPASLTENGTDVAQRRPDALADGDPYFAFRSANESSDFSYNIYGGGPIIKDRLFFFALYEGRDQNSDIYTKDFSFVATEKKPHGFLKLDWNITDNHLLEFTAITNRDNPKLLTYNNDSNYSTKHDGDALPSDDRTGGEVYSLKYTGYLTDSFTLSAQVSDIKSKITDPSNSTAPLCPAVYDGRSGSLTYIGCWDPNFFTLRDPFFVGGPDNTTKPDKDVRRAFRIDAEWQLGDHRIRGGFDHERYGSTHAGVQYSGGVYYRYFRKAAGSTVNTEVLPPGVTDYVRVRHFQSASGAYSVENTAAYIEDSWQVNDRWMLYAGLRSESFDNKNNEGESFVKANNLLAPRFGFSWDVNGDASLKVFGTAGRYYIPVASNTNIRASGFEGLSADFYTFSGIDPVTGAPLALVEQLGGQVVNGSFVSPAASRIADANLKPMSQDEFILGLQKEITPGFTMGVRTIFRNVVNGMDDACAYQPFVDYAEDHGFTYDPELDTAKATCYVINPGNDVTLPIDLNNDGTENLVTVDASYFGLPDYKRKYQAIEIFGEKVTEKWSIQGSYTLSRSFGTVEGYVNSSLEQGDPGITQDFDYRAFEDGTYGYLPNDRRHVLKLFGQYEFNDQWSVGANLIIQSGRPVNCQGYVPATNPVFGGVDADGVNSYTSPSSFYCLRPDLSTYLSHRGDFGRTPWTKTLDMSLTYRPTFADGHLTMKMLVSNIFDSQTVTEYSEQSTRGGTRASPEYDENFLNNANFQAPRSVQFSVGYDF